jgi:hypothetical protein
MHAPQYVDHDQGSARMYSLSYRVHQLIVKQDIPHEYSLLLIIRGLYPCGVLITINSSSRWVPQSKISSRGTRLHSGVHRQELASKSGYLSKII